MLAVMLSLKADNRRPFARLDNNSTLLMQSRALANSLYTKRPTLSPLLMVGYQVCTSCKTHMAMGVPSIKLLLG